MKALDGFQCKLVRRLPPRPANGQAVAIDLETFKQDVVHRPTGIFACATFNLEGEDEVYMVEDTTDLRKAMDRIKNAQWVFQNAMYDLKQLRRYMDIPQRPVWDTMLIEQDLFGGFYDRFGLGHLVRRWLGIVLPKDLQKEFAGTETLTDELREYASNDAYYTMRVKQAQEQYIEDNGETMEWYWDIDEPAMWAIMDMKGVHIDVDAWLTYAEEMKAKAIKEQESLGFNVKSNNTVLALLHKNNINVDSTGKDTLEGEMRGRIPTSKAYKLMADIIRVRGYRTAVERWGPKWIERYVEADGRVYSSWKTTGTETGRMASSDPNLQNIPVRELPIFRTFFTATKGNRMLVADVSQQEPRFLAHLSKEASMIEIFKAGGDLHEATRQELKTLGVSLDRRMAKDINLGTSYGMSPYGLSQRTGIGEVDAEQFIRAYFRARPRVRSWITTTQAKAMKMGYIRTAGGRPVWTNPYSWQADRNAINGPIQGSAADHVKMTISMIHSMCASAGVPFDLVLAIHDEVVSDVTRGTMQEQRRIVESAWVESGKILAPSVPMAVDMVTGFNWGVKS